jgi:hypothetical protein
MIRLVAAAARAGLEYCATCGWWTKPGCGH